MTDVLIRDVPDEVIAATTSQHTRAVGALVTDKEVPGRGMA
jgi:hypothetical protein